MDSDTKWLMIMFFGVLLIIFGLPGLSVIESYFKTQKEIEFKKQKTIQIEACSKITNNIMQAYCFEK